MNDRHDSPALAARGQLFAQLHAGPDPFLIANAWDAGSARMLAGLGFRALATSSGATAGSYGRLDGHITREESLASARTVVQATDLPVSADLENGFGDDPDFVAQTIRLAADVGLVGASIEDATGNPDRPLYPHDVAIARVAAAVDAARSVAHPFTLTARCENYLRSNPDLDDTIHRLQGFAAAGADVLFAPGLPDLDAVRRVCAEVGRPVNFMVAIPSRSFCVAELRDAGVRRISLASSLYRAAMGAMLDAAGEALELGTFDYLTARNGRTPIERFLES